MSDTSDIMDFQAVLGGLSVDESQQKKPNVVKEVEKKEPSTAVPAAFELTSTEELKSFESGRLDV